MKKKGREEMSDKEKYPIQNMIVKWINAGVSILAMVFTIIIAFVAKTAVDNIQEQSQEQSQEMFSQISIMEEEYMTQTQELLNEIELIQNQYLIVQNILSQEQTVDVIQARDNDVLIKTPDDKWLVVPMIEKEDIEFSIEIIEQKIQSEDSTLPRIDLFNPNGDDWTSRNSFTYTLQYLSINQNKMVSLHQFINKITIEFKYFDSDQIDYYSSYHTLYTKGDIQDYLNVFENITDGNEYVTNELPGFNGIEDIKFSIIIEFEIGGSIFSIPYTFDNFITVNED